MASFFNISSRFGRQAPRSNNPANGKPTTPTDQYPPSSPQNPSAPQIYPTQSITSTFSTTSTDTAASNENYSYNSHNSNHSHNPNNSQMANASAPSRRPPFFFREENSGLIVKGNFMTLAAKPEHVDKGEWLAHQVVEQYRLLEGMIKIVQEVDSRTGLPICNPTTCPTMSAGGYIYTWLDKQKNPIKIPAYQYIQLVQQWTLGKINDIKLFPVDTTFSSPATFASGPSNTSMTPIAAGPSNLNVPLSTLAGRDWLGKSSGFPESFQNDIRNLYRQMFRCYAHLYHSHWLEPFYHISSSKELNTCFIHFINVGKLFDLIDDKDIVPMQPLIEIWTAKGLLPQPGSIPAQGVQAA